MITVITNKLDGIMLTNIIRAIDKQFIPRGKFTVLPDGTMLSLLLLLLYTGLYELSVNILQNLAKVPRFGMITMFLNPFEKQGKQPVLNSL